MKPVRALVVLLMAGLLLALLAPLGVAHARSAGTASGATLTVRAYIDGRSDLILHRNTVHWHHLDFAAPGRHEGANFPTSLNSTAWFPTWPDVPSPENRDCHCDSSTFIGVPQLPTRPETVELTIVRARWSASIVQQPDAANDYTQVLEFNDDSPAGADWYVVALTYTDWQVIPSVSPSAVNNAFSGVAALSLSDVWAVGSVFRTNAPRQTLIEHWDGNVWRVVLSPAAGTLTAVTAAAANEVWAVGSNFNAATSRNQVVIEHWEGRGWQVVPGTNPGTGDNMLSGVTAMSAHDVWAVGHSTQAIPRSTGVTPLTVPNPVTQTLIEHWNGGVWRTVASPNPAMATNSLNAVAAVSSADIWAVGQQAPAGETPDQTLIERWNGKAWSVVQSPNAGAAGGVFKGVAVINKDNVWAVGVSAAFQSSLSFRTLVAHWNGRSWQSDPSPNVGQSGSILFAVAGIPRTEKLWAVGYYNTPSVFLRALTEFSD